jgi:hypothetical protein
VTGSDQEPLALDRRLVPLQLGRELRGRWRVGSRCRFGRPTVIVTAPRLADGSPFPTLYWLTCPWLNARIGAEESSGSGEVWAGRVSEDAGLATAVRAADAQYRAARAEEAGGGDPCAGTGIAGQRDPTAVKCLHAHAAAFLGGIGDPVGRSLLARIGTECPDDLCAGPFHAT